MVLSFADSDLAGLAGAYAADKGALPSLRLAHLRDLRHPMSIDLWIDKVGRHAKVIHFRKKKEGWTKKRGHRQPYTEVLITAVRA